MQELDCLSDIGRSENFKNVFDYFWHIIVVSDDFKEEHVEFSIKKYAEMVKFWSLDKKQVLFCKIITQLTSI